MKITYDKTPTCDWTKRVALGKVNGKTVYLAPPSWDCGWYWGCGYVQNSHMHTHLDTILKETGVCPDKLADWFDEGTFRIIPDDRWTFIELIKTMYHYKKHAEVLSSGGMHVTTNPLQSALTNHAEVKKINTVTLPLIFKAISEILDRCTTPKQYKVLKTWAKAETVTAYSMQEAEKKADYIHAHGAEIETIVTVEN